LDPNPLGNCARTNLRPEPSEQVQEEIRRSQPEKEKHQQQQQQQQRLVLWTFNGFCRLISHLFLPFSATA